MVTGAVFFYTLTIMLDGGTDRATFAPGWLAAVMPNFAAAFIIPLAPLVPPRTVPFRELVRLSLLAFVGLTLYEFMQQQMPRRTFDLLDIVASGLGAAAAIGFGRALFFRQR